MTDGIVSTKVCYRCSELKPLADFFKSSASSDGLGCICRSCNREAMREYRAKNIEKFKKIERERSRKRFATGELQAWQFKNPEKRKDSLRASSARYQARKDAAGDELSESDWLELVAEHGSKCNYCLRDLQANEVTRDHLVPLSKGGTNDRSNMVPACLQCNHRKGARSADDFRAELLCEQL